MGKTDKTEKDKLSGFEGFDEITKRIIPGSMSESDEDIFNPDNGRIEGDDEEEVIESEDKDKKEDDSDDDATDDTETEDDNDEDKVDVEKVEDDIDEVDLVEPFVDLFIDELGWKVDEDKKPKNIEEVINFISSIIDENSKPKYSSEVSARFDKFISDGGDAKDFFSKYYNGLDLSSLSLKNEDHQKQILREYYRRKGFAESKIEKNIQRILDLDELEDEAKDAYSELKEMDEEQQKTIVEQQSKSKQKEIEERVRFIEEVEKRVEATDDIYGVKLNKKEKTELLDHVFSVGKDGKTQQQRDYAENPIEYLIITSFAYKNKDKIKSLLKGKVETDSVKKFKEKQKTLLYKSKGKNDGGEDHQESGNDWLNDFKIK